jgi:LPPG:FO 2-phospho-L-lactate transferase
LRVSLSGEDSISITFLSGGTGTPKLLQGVRLLLKDKDLSVIVNTAEDLWYQGGHISPDIDTVMYLFAGILNTDTWWGIRGDSFTTHEFLTALGEDTYLTIGDRDRAVELLRGRLMHEGMTLSEATREISRRLLVHAEVIPMTDQEYTTMVRTDSGLIHFQEYWVKHRGKIPIREVLRVPRGQPDATQSALDAIYRSDLVIIGPSNPVTSISPILECSGITDALRKKTTVAVSPFIGDQPVSGPARELMVARGLEPTSAGVFSAYTGIADIFIQDIRDPVEVPGSLRCDTLMKSPDVAKNLVVTILKKTGYQVEAPPSN